GRKAVVYFSEGINYDVVDPINNKYATDVQHEMNDVIAAATRGNVNVYSVDPRGVTTGMEDAIEIGGLPVDNSISPTMLTDEMRIEHDSLRVVADQTGGVATPKPNHLPHAFSPIPDANNSHTLLWVYTTDEE